MNDYSTYYSFIGGGALVYFTESEIRINSVIDEHLKEDLDRIRERSPDAFKISKNGQHSVGSVWKTSALGTVHPDKTYFVFGDWSWLNGVKIGGAGGSSFSGGEKLKSYVDGIGLRVEKINDKWEYKTDSWQNTRDIEVKRVLTKNGYQFHPGKGTCLLRITDKPATEDSSLYLLVGFMKVNPKDKMSKPDYEEFVEGHESFCNDYARGIYGINNGGSEIAISFDVINGQITGNEYPEIADSKSLTPIYLDRENPVNAVVLALAIKGQMTNTVGEWAGKHLNRQQAVKEIGKKISKSIVGIFNGNKMTGFKINKESNGGNKLKGEKTEDWIATAKVTYK